MNTTPAPTTPPATASSRAASWLLVACLLCFLAAALSHAWRTSATFDEVTHLPAGYASLQHHDYRLNPEHPPLVKAWAALPLLAQTVWPDAPDHSDPAHPDGWTPTRRAAQSAWALALLDNDPQWWYGHYFLYGLKGATLARLGVGHPLQVATTTPLTPADYVNHADRLLFAGRFQIVLLGVGLAVLIGLWTRALFGAAGAVLATALFCFDPNGIAHASLVTTDIGLALFWFGTVYAFWRLSQGLTLRRVAVTGLWFGLALASKFSAILLLPVLAALALVVVVRAPPWIVGRPARAPVTTKTAKAVVAAVTLAAIGLVGYVMLWAAYGFRSSAAADPAAAAVLERAELAAAGQAPGPHRVPGRFPLENVLRRDTALQELRLETGQEPPEPDVQQRLPEVSLGLVDRLLLWSSTAHLLPEAYPYGFAVARLKGRVRAGYLVGQYSTAGWWYYFPVCFLVKTPLLSLLAIGGALALCWRGRVRLDGPALWFLLVPVGVYLAVSMTSALNIGQRHLLPIYPFLYVAAGVWGRVWESWPTARRGPAAAVALGAIAVSSVVVFAPPWRPAVVAPHYLAYFNELAGGPRQGSRWLVDSNLDWGQDLPDLRRWLEAHPTAEPVSLCYFGMADPRYHGIRAANLEGGYLFAPTTPLDRVPTPGYLVISATARKGVYFTPAGRALSARLLDNARWVDTLGYSLFIYHLDAPPR